MARFEMIVVSGEKILVEAPEAATVADLVLLLGKDPFLVLNEYKASTGMREIVVATSSIVLLRPVADGAMQGSNFVSKR